MREVEFVLDAQVEASVFESVEGVRNVVVAGNHVEMSFGGDMGELLTTVTERYGVADIKTTEADLGRDLPDVLPRGRGRGGASRDARQRICQDGK